jgi:hypothetical protein
MKRLVTFAIASAACVVAMAGCSAPETTESDAMLNGCIDRIATWAGISSSEVTGADRNGENASGEAWDFEGEYTGGSWACGGAAGQAEPSTVMVYPETGAAQDIVSGGISTSGPGESEPVSVLAGLTDSSQPPSEGCLSGMRALAEMPFSASEGIQNAAVKTSVGACGTAGEYVRAIKAYPEAWGFVDASYIDGQTALNTIQAACSLDASAPVCVNASENGLL